MDKAVIPMPSVAIQPVLLLLNDNFLSGLTELRLDKGSKAVGRFDPQDRLQIAASYK
jgi:hypothetical protein